MTGKQTIAILAISVAALVLARGAVDIRADAADRGSPSCVPGRRLLADRCGSGGPRPDRTDATELVAGRQGGGLPIVVRYLVSQGVDPNIISGKGRGETHPEASNDTPEGRAKNRRIEVVTEQPTG